MTRMPPKRAAQRHPLQHAALQRHPLQRAAQRHQLQHAALQRHPLLVSVVLLPALFAACESSPTPTSGDGGSNSGGAPSASGGSPSTGGQPTVPQGGAGGASPSSGGASLGGLGGLGLGGLDMTGLGPFAAYPSVPYPEENPDSEPKRLLGKVLFWEEQLSSNDAVACGTCHRANAGGSDPRSNQLASIHPGLLPATSDDRHGAQGLRRCSSPGVFKVDSVFGDATQVTRRKPPSYLDAMFATELFWDGRAKSKFTDPYGTVRILSGGALESQSMGPPVSDAEMGCEDRSPAASGWSLIETKLATATPLAFAKEIPSDLLAFIGGQDLASRKTYLELFQAAFPTATKIEAHLIAFAIATHERSLTSNQTRWDAYNAALQAGDLESSILTEQEKRGLRIFNTTGRCNLCHAAPLFTDNTFHNLGFFDEDPVFDAGREEVTGSAFDRGKVKTPTLRNVALRESGGLLHTGAGKGASLAAVLQAYVIPPNIGNVDPLISGGGILPLGGKDVADLEAFLRALTDPRVENETAPFDRPKFSTE